MDSAYADKLDGKITEDFWERKANDWRIEEQQVKMAIDGLNNAETGDRALDAQRIFELANKAYSLYVSQDSTKKGQLAENAIFRQVHLDRCTIDLTNTKEWSARTVHLNADSIAALESIRLKGQKPSDSVFQPEGSRFDTRSWFLRCLVDTGIEGYVWHSNRHTFCS